MRGNAYNTLIGTALTITAALSAVAVHAQDATAPAQAPTVSAAPGSVGAPPAIAAAYQQMDRALERRDARAFLSYYAPNAVFFDLTGVMHHQDAIASDTANTIKYSQSIAGQTTIQSAVVQPDGTTVTVRHSIVKTDIDPKSAVVNTMVVGITERDHWIQVNGVWKINRVRLISGYAQTNGKNIPMGE